MVYSSERIAAYLQCAAKSFTGCSLETIQRPNGRVLKTVVDYCYIYHADLFDEISCDDSWARVMVQLAAAADFFGLSLLRKKVTGLSELKMEEKPGVAYCQDAAS
jgi:hypothetical protein